MRRRVASISVVVALALIATARSVEACSCMAVGPPCQAFWGAEAVFDATVLKIEQVDLAPVNDYPGDDVVVSVEVHASYKGADPGPLDITTRSTDGACGYAFKTGTRYLIFARQGVDGRLSVSLCSATREFDGTGPDQRFLASLSRPSQGGRVFGTVRTTLWPPGASPTTTPLVTDVTLSGSAGVAATRSVNGVYEFTGLAPGAYRLDIKVPDGYGGGYGLPRDVRIADSRGCTQADVSVGPAGGISGRLVDDKGRPLRGAPVQLGAADDPSHWFPRTETTEHDGWFAFPALSPGRYVLGVNPNDVPTSFNPYPRTLYPGGGLDPQVVELALGQVVDLGMWFMPPPLDVVTVRGIVVCQDGTPVAGVFVNAWDVTVSRPNGGGGAGSDTSGRDGRFVLELRHGRDYAFGASSDRGRLRIVAPKIRADAAAPASIRIVIVE